MFVSLLEDNMKKLDLTHIHFYLLFKNIPCDNSVTENKYFYLLQETDLPYNLSDMFRIVTHLTL